MSKVTCQISVSVDGYVAGPNQRVDEPLGGERLHEWAVATDRWREQHGRSGGERNADAEVIEEAGAKGGTTYHFVTDRIEQARAAAGDKHVTIAGGAQAVQLDELYLHIVPVVLGAGERLLANVGDPKLEPVKVVESPAVTHVKYRVVR